MVHLQGFQLSFKFSVPSCIDVESLFENLNGQLSGLQPSSEDNEILFKTRYVHPPHQYMDTPNSRYTFLTLKHQNALEDIMSNDRIFVPRTDTGSGTLIY